MAAVSNVLKRGFATTSVKNVIKNVTVIGGGLMGSGIAQVSAFYIDSIHRNYLFIWYHVLRLCWVVAYNNKIVVLLSDAQC